MNQFRDRRKVVSLTLVGLAYLLIVTPLIINNLQKQQQIQGHAQTAPIPSPPLCGVANSNTMMIIDRSGSMGETDASGGTKISNAIVAGNNFVDLIAKNTQNELGLISFSTTATTGSPMTSNFSSVKTEISALKASGSTCIQCAIDQADKAITAGKRSNIKNVMVLLTDGIANYVEGQNQQVSQSVAEQAALTAAANSHKNNDTIIFAIGLGKDVNASFLKQLATSTGGEYYFPPSSSNLTDIYNQISQIIARGSVSGYVFNDGNKNGQFDQNEQKLSGWTIQITQQGSSTSQSVTTDSTGSFLLPNLCNGTYTLKEVVQSGWEETVPTNPDSYTIDISTGNAITDKVFGNSIAPPTPTPTTVPTATPTPMPTATPTPSTTKLSMTVLLDGIGSRGDNANPTASSLSNKNPQHTKIDTDITVYTTSNAVIASGTGTLTYNQTNGNYIGDIPISAGFPTGIYIIKVKTNSHLRKQADGIQTLTAGADNVISPIALVTGDINDDNVLNILDYNLLLNCYSDLTQAVDCPSMVNKTDADLNDDGSVNQIDYNLFIRELSTQPGQ